MNTGVRYIFKNALFFVIGPVVGKGLQRLRPGQLPFFHEGFYQRRADETI